MGVAWWVPRKADPQEEINMQKMPRGRCPDSKLAGNEGSRTGQRSWAALQSHQRPWGIPSGSPAELPELGPQNGAFVSSPNVMECGLSQGESVALKQLPRGGTQLQTGSCRRSQGCFSVRGIR